MTESKNINRLNDSMGVVRKTKGKKTYNTKGSLWFYVCFLAWPLLQFAVFYIGVNFNSFLLAFKTTTAEGDVVFSLFENFKYWFEKKRGLDDLMPALIVSLKAYAVHLLIGVPLGVLFSYYIFKRLPGSMFFRFMLFLPSILSALVLVLVFKFFIQTSFPGVLKDVFGYNLGDRAWIDDGKVNFILLMFYNIFAGFGTSVLLYSNKMSAISPDILEAAELDGVTSTQEFLHIVLPEAYPTISVFLITGVAAIFTNQYNAYPLTAGRLDPGSSSIGFLLYDMVKDASSSQDILEKTTDVQHAAALGIIISAFVIPITFLIRHLLLKYGPSED